MIERLNHPDHIAGNSVGQCRVGRAMEFGLDLVGADQVRRVPEHFRQLRAVAQLNSQLRRSRNVRGGPHERLHDEIAKIGVGEILGIEATGP